MASMNNNFRINNILPKLITSKHHCQEFLLGSSIILMSTIKCLAGIVDDIHLLVNPLSLNSSNSKITSITHNFKGKIPVRWLYYRSGYQGFLKNFEGFLTIFIIYKRNILLEKIGEGSQGLRKVLDNSSIETSMAEKTTNTFDVPWIGHPFNSFNLCLVHFNSPFGNLVTQNYTFVNHEMALLPIEHQICFFASLQNFIKIVETVVKGGSIDGKVIHEDLHNLLTETMKYTRHTPLKSSRCITQTKRHTPISISTVRTRESGILLILSVNMNLGEARIPIKIAEVGVFRQPVEHLINKGQRIVVLPGGVVQLPKTNTHSISNNSPLRY